MNNNAEKIIPINDYYNQEYLNFDLNKYEKEIRQDERNKMKSRYRAMQRRKKIQRKEVINELIYYLIQKTIGVLLIVGTILICNSPLSYVEEVGGNDWTISLLFIPIGIGFLFTKEKWIF